MSGESEKTLRDTFEEAAVGILAFVSSRRDSGVTQSTDQLITETSALYSIY